MKNIYFLKGIATLSSAICCHEIMLCQTAGFSNFSKRGV